MAIPANLQTSSCHGPVEDVPCDDPVGVVVTGRGKATVVAADAGQFAVLDGKKVIADVRPDALPGVVETMAVGPVLGTLAYQRGILSLHSNTIVIDGKAIALSGGRERGSRLWPPSCCSAATA